MIHNLPSGHAIFCDDVRHEVTGKVTLVGTYNHEMTVLGVSPVELSQLWIVIRFFDDPTSFPKKVTFLVSRHTEEQEEELSKTVIEVPEASPLAGEPDQFVGSGRRFVMVGLSTRLDKLVFAEECRLRVRALVDDDELWLGSLQVKIAEPDPTTGQFNLPSG